MEWWFDFRSLGATEQRVVVSLLPLLESKTEGVVRAVNGEEKNLDKFVVYTLRPGGIGWQVVGPDNVPRAELMRPIVLGGIRKMLTDLRSNPYRIGTKTVVEAPKARADVELAGKDLAELLRELRQPSPGIYAIQFSDGSSIRVDRLAQNFRCKGFGRADLAKKLGVLDARWGKLSKESQLSDETQASMAPLLYLLGAVTAKEQFMMGAHQDQEFQIRQQLNFARANQHDRIALAFVEFSGVADACLKLSMAPKEVLACLNGYAALGLVRARAKEQVVAKQASEGFLSKLKSRLGS